MLKRLLFIGGILSFAAACGGGGGGSSRAPATPPPAALTDFERGIFSNSGIYKDVCLNPRPGNFPDSQGTAADENDWLRAWSHDLYLWYDEIDDVDPRSFSTPAYFDLMKTFALTPSGAPKDQFHFTFDTEAWLALSQSGVSAGYGAEFELLSASPPREIVIAFVVAGSPAAAAGLARGTQILAVDGVDVVNGADTDTLNAGLFPASAGETHQFVVQDVGSTTSRSVSLLSAQITEDPVPTAATFDTARGPVGYMLFNTHIATAEARLVNEIQAFAAAGITELILDLRYNGGGFLDIANELAFMIAGPSAASGRVFNETQFNAKHPVTNPVTGQALTPDTFHTVTQGFSLSAGTALPSVNLPRLFVLSGPGTCSASEAIINGLRGIDIEVVLIGDTTCGKPYGFYPQDNCGTTYFSTQFRGVNAKGFGDFADGFVPVQTPVQAYEVAGCEVPDDFDTPLGDPSEARLAAALSYIDTGTCPAAPVTAASRQKLPGIERGGPSIVKPRKMPGMVRR